MKDHHKILEGYLPVFHGLGWKDADLTPFETVTLRTGASKREFSLSFLTLEDRPFFALALPRGFETPDYEEIYTRYLDFNFEIFLLFKHLDKTSPDTSYLLYFDQQRCYLFDVPGRECLVHCSHPDQREDRLFPHLERKEVLSGSLEKINRKSNDQLARELNGWVNLWSARLGSHTSARKKTLERFMRKLLLSRYYRVLFGPESPRLLFEGFVEDPAHLKAARHLASPPEFFKKLFEYFQSRFSLDLFKPGKVELSFLHHADRQKHLLNEFLLEFNLLGRIKFSLEVFLTAWLPQEQRLLSARKTCMDSRTDLKKELAVEDHIVIKPILARPKRDGIPWCLHLFDEAVQYWNKFNMTPMGKAAFSYPGSLQMDIFGASPGKMTREGRILNLPNHTLRTSFRVSGLEKPWSRESFLFLLCAKCFELWKKYDIPGESLDAMDQIFHKPIL